VATEPVPHRGATPEAMALQGFAPDTEAYIAGVRYDAADAAVVQVGFPGKDAFYYLLV
jgi:hypothetical protein